MEARVIFVVVLVVSVLSQTSTGVPIQDVENLFDDVYIDPYDNNRNAYVEINRRVRSPDGEIDVHGQHFTHNGGFAKGEYNHRLWQDGKAHLDANAYYQRNWGNTPGPRKDYGAGLKLTVPLGRH